MQPVISATQAKTITDAFWRDADSGNMFGGLTFSEFIRCALSRAFIEGEAVVLFSNSDGFKAEFLDNTIDYAVDRKGDLQSLKSKRKAAGKGAFHVLRFRPDPKNGLGRSSILPLIPALNDIEEINCNLINGIKTASKVGLVLETQSQTPELAAAVFGQVSNDIKPNDTLAGVENEFNSKVATLGAGEKLNVISDDRPGQNTMEFLDRQIMLICWAFGLPPEIVYDISSLRGANSRVRLADLKKFVADKREKLQVLVNKIFAYWAVATGAIELVPASKQVALLSPNIVYPPDVTADEKYQGQLAINLVASGMMTLQDWVQSQGLSYEEFEVQLDKEFERKQARNNQQLLINDNNPN